VMSPHVVINWCLVIRATGTISPNSKVHAEVVEFQRRAAMTLMELAKGDDLYGGRTELAALFEPLRAAIEDEQRSKMN
jgi:hypothetical protein